MAVFRITLLITILAAVAVQASRSPESPNAITERQAPGTPLYECHSDCGMSPAQPHPCLSQIPQHNLR